MGQMSHLGAKWWHSVSPGVLEENRGGRARQVGTSSSSVLLGLVAHFNPSPYHTSATTVLLEFKLQN